MNHRRITLIALLLLAGPPLTTPVTAAAKHHRTEMERWTAKLHRREANEEHWAAEADQKAQAAEEKRAAHQGKWEKMMDTIGRPQAQPAPVD
jgi:hypothetical protein